MSTTKERKVTVDSYSGRGALAYDDPMNQKFLYGRITEEFLRSIPLSGTGKRLLDIGCGTGFGFEILRNQLTELNFSCVGVEPAAGMLQLAHPKFADDDRFSFHQGSFESTGLEDGSIDQIISTLALHWVKDLKIALTEMRRVLKDTGRLDILMIAKDDGANFKRAIVATQKKHLTFKQIMSTATLVQRQTQSGCQAVVEECFEGFHIEVTEHRHVVDGTFDEHMKWWSARSTPVIAEVEDKDQFFIDLRVEMEKNAINGKIPFDSAFLHIRLDGEKRIG